MEKGLVITGIQETGDGFHVTAGCSGFFMPKKYIGAVVPQIGDVIDLVTKCGSVVVGMYLNGELLYQKTDEQLEQEHQEYLEQAKKEREEQFETHKAQMDANFEALPGLLRHRLAMYRRFVPDFRADGECYEEMSMRVGFKVYEHCQKTGEAISVWKQRPFEEQVADVPEFEEISGNMFGFAIAFAEGIAEDKGRGIDLYNPVLEDLQKSGVMHMLNAMYMLSGAYCWPHAEYIDKYVAEILIAL